jgi:hypothetical protein
MVTLTRSTLTTDTALCQPAISRQVHPHIHHQATFKASLGVSQGGGVRLLVSWGWRTPSSIVHVGF